MARIFTYRGKSSEDLQKMTLDQIIDILPARQRRTLRRGLTDAQKKLLRKIEKRKGEEKPVRTRVRDMIILPQMIGARVAIYDGKEYKPVTIIAEMIGHYIGEFALTRKRVQHGSPGFGATRGSKFVPLK